MSLLSKFFKLREANDGDIQKPFLEHMEDLRWTLLKMATALVIAVQMIHRAFHLEGAS